MKLFVRGLIVSILFILAVIFSTLSVAFEYLAEKISNAADKV